MELAPPAQFSELPAQTTVIGMIDASEPGLREYIKDACMLKVSGVSLTKVMPWKPCKPVMPGLRSLMILAGCMGVEAGNSTALVVLSEGIMEKMGAYVPMKETAASHWFHTGLSLMLQIYAIIRLGNGHLGILQKEAGACSDTRERRAKVED